VNSYVDDISVNITVVDIHKELNSPTLIMDSKNPFRSLPMIEQATQLTVAKTQRSWQLSTSRTSQLNRSN